MKLIWWLVVIALFIGYCDDARRKHAGPENKEITGQFKMPEQLSDCKLYKVLSNNYSHNDFMVIRCSNGSASIMNDPIKND